MKSGDIHRLYDELSDGDGRITINGGAYRDISGAITGGEITLSLSGCLAPEWNGAGLPPVGTECEIAASTEYLKISYPEGAKVKIYAHFKHDCGCEFAAFVDSNCQVYGIGMAKVFRPIRTPEQIAADEREAAIEELTAGYTHSIPLTAWAERAYDHLGYRKQSTKQDDQQ